jgi:hypothetical protein
LAHGTHTTRTSDVKTAALPPQMFMARRDTFCPKKAIDGNFRYTVNSPTSSLKPSIAACAVE